MIESDLDMLKDKNKKKSLNKNKSTKMITQIEVLNYLENKIESSKI